MIQNVLQRNKKLVNKIFKSKIINEILYIIYINIINFIGVLAMEALHRQVLPFVLRRMKEDVLSDLPAKITQVNKN